MEHRFLLSLAIVALVGAACSQAPETLVAGTGSATETVAELNGPGQRPTDESTTSSSPENAPSPAEPEQEAREQQQAAEPTATVAPDVGLEPGPTTSIDGEPVPPWQDHDLARVMLTGDDLALLGLTSGWEVGLADFVEIDEPEQDTDVVCGTALPAETSYFVASFEELELGMELGLRMMPATSGTTTAADYLTTLQLLATCPALEGDFAAIAMEIVATDVQGADQSLVIAGTDATSPSEPIGLTLAAAVADGHLFIAFVAQDSGRPASGDADLAVKVLEISISRL